MDKKFNFKPEEIQKDSMRYSSILNNVLAVTLTATITALFTVVTGFQWRLFILIWITLGVVAVFIANFVIKFYREDYRKIEMVDRLPTDIRIEEIENKVVFDSGSLEDGEARVEGRRKIQNNMTEEGMIYRNFKIEIQSSQAVPTEEDIEILVEDEKKEPREVFCNTEGDLNLLQLSIPIDLEPGETKEFTYKYRTKAYKKVIQGESDYMSFSVQGIIGALTMRVLLEGDAKDKFKLRKSSEGLDSFEVIDYSDERMEVTEQKLQKNSINPDFQEDEAEWEVTSPKVGYEYRLHFEFLRGG